MTSTDQKILAVVAGVETSSHVLEAAVERAGQESASLVVLHVMPTHVYESRYDSFEKSPDLKYDGFTFTRNQALKMATSVAERAAKAAIGDRPIPYTAVGRIGSLVSTVLAVAAAHDCATIMIGESVSWWGFRSGRADRKIAKRFDGTVVRVPRPAPENLTTTRSLPTD